MAKPKKINYELLPEDHSAYELMREVREENHDETAPARIALAWHKGLKADVDGHVVLGKCMKASDLQRELVNWDFVIILNQITWNYPEFDKEKKMALIDHELCHAARVYDKDGEPKIDSKGRPVWRVRKHDIEEFQEIVDRHGIWKRDLQRFADALLKKRKPSLFEIKTPEEEDDTALSDDVAQVIQ